MSERENLLEDMRKLFTYGATQRGGVLSRTTLINNYYVWCYKKIFGAFEFKGLPPEWDRDFFLETLFRSGIIAVCDTAAGIVPLNCGLTGINIYSRPTTAIFANPVLGNFERDLYGDNPKTSCALIKLQYNYLGVSDIVDRYAVLLANCDNSISVNLQNSKVALIGFVTNKKNAADMQRMYAEIDSGKPAVYVKRDDISKDDIYYNHVKETYIANDLQLLKNQIKDDFLTEIGLNNANTDKRERLIVDEVNANNFEIKANVQHWLDNINDGLKRCKELFGIDITCNLRRFDGGIKNENITPDVD